MPSSPYRTVLLPVGVSARHAVTTLGNKVTPGVRKIVVNALLQRKLVRFYGKKIE